MAWLRYSDDWNGRPEIRALDDATYRAFQCLIEAAERFDACGIVTDDYAMGVYPHDARQKLRNQIRKLADRGLVHLPDDPGNYHPNCPSCQTRKTEAAEDMGEDIAKTWPMCSRTSCTKTKTHTLHVCIPWFFEVAMTPEAKREKRRKDAERQQRKRDKDKAAASRRDAEPPSRPPVPVPVPQLKINDHVPPPSDHEPSSTANPSTPSNGTADRDAVSWLRKELDRRRTACTVSCNWKPEHQEHLGAVVLKASRAPGDTFKILTGALDGFFADPTQLKYRYSPAGLAHGFDTYAADVLEQEAAEASARRRVEQEKKLAAIDAAILAKDEEKKAAQRAEREAKRNGQDPVALAELMRSIGGGKS